MTVCWYCETGINFGETPVNYCPACGMRLRQKCPYPQCNQDISCDLDECPHCSRIFARCSKCNIVYNIEQTVCKECGHDNSQICDIFQSVGVSLSRENCYLVKKQIDANIPRLSFNRPISPFVIFNKNMVYWRSIDNHSRIYCLNLVTNTSIWEGSTVETVDIQVRDVNYLEINGAYVITYLKNRIIINSLTDGGIVANISIASRYKACMQGARLFLLREEARSQKLEVYEHPFISLQTINQIPLTGSKRNFHALPVVGDKCIYYVDCNGDISRLNTDNMKYDIIHSYQNEADIEFLALHNDYLLFTKKGLGDMRTISRVDINSTQNLSTDTTIVNNIKLSTPKFAVYDNSLYLCEDFNDTLRFSKYPITGLVGAADEHKTANTSFVADFYSIVVNKGVSIIFKCKSRVSNAFEIRHLDFRSDVQEKLGSVLPSNPVCIGNLYNKIVIAELNNGSVYIK